MRKAKGLLLTWAPSLVEASIVNDEDFIRRLAPFEGENILESPAERQTATERALEQSLAKLTETKKQLKSALNRERRYKKKQRVEWCTEDGWNCLTFRNTHFDKMPPFAFYGCKFIDCSIKDYNCSTQFINCTFTNCTFKGCFVRASFEECRMRKPKFSTATFYRDALECLESPTVAYLEKLGAHVKG